MNTPVRKVEVVPYNPAWPEAFRQEAGEIRRIFGPEIVNIYHIGSTSIPGIYAKPIVDLMVEVHSIERIDDYNPIMIREGYLPKGEYGIPGRRFFIKGDEIHRTHHIHFFATGHPEIERHILFREYLIAHPEDMQAYSQLKIDLARQFSTNVTAYQDGKSDLILDLDEKARAWKNRDR